MRLLHAYGIGPDETPDDNFTDAGDTYYTGYLAAAKRLGLTAGSGSCRKVSPGRRWLISATPNMWTRGRSLRSRVSQRQV